MTILLSERLLALLTEEIAVLESLYKEENPQIGQGLDAVAAAGRAGGGTGAGAETGAGALVEEAEDEAAEIAGPCREGEAGPGLDLREDAAGEERSGTAYGAERMGQGVPKSAFGRPRKPVLFRRAAAEGDLAVEPVEPEGPGDVARKRRAKNGAACKRSAAPAEGSTARAGTAGRAGGPRSKERAEALGQLTRTLEKLLELKRLEMLAGQGGAEDRAETERLRAEFLLGLRNLDARRRAGPTLFDPQTGAYAGHLPAAGEPEGPTGVAGLRDALPN
ncbi:hypothetical protein [Aurantimonas sp. VKM B-3413]|uniref:hypothetical protein n=1 Tax=Aurantimonas sp. VKM B-3413 TaxID=2779401 RepID=UPI001E5053FA|nr:hypothetical protein [Aurantimonas sp. VKM B-3413]MCB8836107.1 hypothetical protein [Aurantimonas sp. VKM B-3413]